MKFNKRDRPSFFKVLLRDEEDYLPLPLDFAKKYLEKGSNKTQTVVLKTKSGDKWKVKYLKVEDIYYFVDGWLDFMKDNHLKHTDFLVFWLLSPPPKSIFRVSFYSPNGCLKQPTSNSDNLGSVARTVEHSNDDHSGVGNDSFKKIQNSLEKLVGKAYTKQIPLNRRFGEDTGINIYDKVQLKNDKGKLFHVNLKMWARGQDLVPNLGGGWSHFMKENNVNVGDTCVFNHVEDDLLHVQVIKKKVIKKKGKKGRPSSKSID